MPLTALDTYDTTFLPLLPAVTRPPQHSSTAWIGQRSPPPRQTYRGSITTGTSRETTVAEVLETEDGPLRTLRSVYLPLPSMRSKATRQGATNERQNFPTYHLSVGSPSIIRISLLKCITSMFRVLGKPYLLK